MKILRRCALSLALLAALLLAPPRSLLGLLLGPPLAPAGRQNQPELLSIRDFTPGQSVVTGAGRFAVLSCSRYKCILWPDSALRVGGELGFNMSGQPQRVTYVRGRIAFYLPPWKEPDPWFDVVLGDGRGAVEPVRTVIERDPFPSHSFKHWNTPVLFCVDSAPGGATVASLPRVTLIRGELLRIPRECSLFPPMSAGQSTSLEADDRGVFSDPVPGDPTLTSEVTQQVEKILARPL
jgi:hypothetical protein